MFFQARGPVEPAGDALRALRLSMNTPVVAIELLPPGPARAAIALHAGPPEHVRISIAVRSLRTGQTAYFASGEELHRLRSAGVAMDAALTFAEGMGFLFDEDEVETRGERGPREAAALWRELVGGDEAIEPVPATPPPGDAAELWLKIPAGLGRSAVPVNVSPERSARATGAPRAPAGPPAPPRPGPEQPAGSAMAPRSGSPDAGGPAARPARPGRERVRGAMPQSDTRGYFTSDSSEPAAAHGRTDQGGPGARRDASAGRLLEVIAETAIDRICGRRETAPLPLTKFRGRF